MICHECHHRPSTRIVEEGAGNYAATCFCGCHDLADHAPALLGALKLASIWTEAKPYDSPEQIETHNHILAVIKAAERKS